MCGSITGISCLQADNHYSQRCPLITPCQQHYSWCGQSGDDLILVRLYPTPSGTIIMSCHLVCHFDQGGRSLHSFGNGACVRCFAGSLRLVRSAYPNKYTYYFLWLIGVNHLTCMGAMLRRMLITSTDWVQATDLNHTVI